MTGAVASERVSEALEGLLRMVGNHPQSAKAEEGLTATPTGGAGTKVGLSGNAKVRIEAPVNGGRNYNGPKVAKFLVR